MRVVSNTVIRITIELLLNVINNKKVIDKDINKKKIVSNTIREELPEESGEKNKRKKRLE